MSAQPMIRSIAANGLVVCSITTTVKRLENKDSVFAPHGVLGTDNQHKPRDVVDASRSDLAFLVDGELFSEKYVFSH